MLKYASDKFVELFNIKRFSQVEPSIDTDTLAKNIILEWYKWNKKLGSTEDAQLVFKPKTLEKLKSYVLNKTNLRGKELDDIIESIINILMNNYDLNKGPGSTIEMPTQSGSRQVKNPLYIVDAICDRLAPAKTTPSEEPLVEEPQGTPISGGTEVPNIRDTVDTKPNPFKVELTKAMVDYARGRGSGPRPELFNKLRNEIKKTILYIAKNLIGKHKVNDLEDAISIALSTAMTKYDPKSNRGESDLINIGTDNNPIMVRDFIAFAKGIAGNIALRYQKSEAISKERNVSTEDRIGGEEGVEIGDTISDNKSFSRPEDIAIAKESPLHVDTSSFEDLSFDELKSIYLKLNDNYIEESIKNAEDNDINKNELLEAIKALVIYSRVKNSVNNKLDPKNRIDRIALSYLNQDNKIKNSLIKYYFMLGMGVTHRFLTGEGSDRDSRITGRILLSLIENKLTDQGIKIPNISSLADRMSEIRLIFKKLLEKSNDEASNETENAEEIADSEAVDAIGGSQDQVVQADPMSQPITTTQPNLSSGTTVTLGGKIKYKNSKWSKYPENSSDPTTAPPITLSKVDAELLLSTTPGLSVLWQTGKLPSFDIEKNGFIVVPSASEIGITNGNVRFLVPIVDYKRTINKAKQHGIDLNNPADVAKYQAGTRNVDCVVKRKMFLKEVAIQQGAITSLGDEVGFLKWLVATDLHSSPQPQRWKPTIQPTSPEAQQPIVENNPIDTNVDPEGTIQAFGKFKTVKLAGNKFKEIKKSKFNFID